MSPRSELWLMLQLFVVLNVFPGMWLRGESPWAWAVVQVLAELLFLFPLYIRRARQMGSIVTGVTAMVGASCPWLLSLLSYLCCGWNAAEELLWPLPQLVFLLALLPLLLWGGTFAGRKNAWHRAAIAGDRARAERLLAYFPSGLLKKSEKGYLAHEYAQKAGHDELAAWLRAQEEEQAAQKTAAE